jgi:K(+)-stimulated pyrophosphate-energized sodium pump
VIQVLTQYFTDTKFKPVQEIAESTQTGPATTILSGFSVGLESTVWAILVIAAVIAGAFVLGDNVAEQLYFISLAGMGMLTTVGVIVSMDTYGPVSDNVLTRLDAVGNSTKAITKGIAIATAVIAATSLFGSFAEAVLGALGEEGVFPISVDKPDVLVGLLIGGSVAFLFSSLAIRAVGRAASQVVVEVRNQFREHPGIMEYKEQPNYARVVDICTKTSLRELLTPGLLAVLSPIIVGFALEAEALGAFLAGSILTGQLLAVMFSNSGGAWDNAKKFVEEGHYGGKGSEAHKAAVIGDTVGDPFKDTAGPALNPLIKVMNLVALLFAPVVVEQAENDAVRIVVVVAAGTKHGVPRSHPAVLQPDGGDGRTALRGRDPEVVGHGPRHDPDPRRGNAIAREARRRRASHHGSAARGQRVPRGADRRWNGRGERGVDGAAFDPRREPRNAPRRRGGAGRAALRTPTGEPDVRVQCVTPAPLV